MSWLMEDPSYTKVIAEIESQTDRAAALIASSLLEDRLLKLIKSSAVGHIAIENKMFKGSGPLASFSAKIDLGFILGLFDAEVHKRQHTIREIRNEFAHNIQPVQFTSQRVVDLCANLAPSQTTLERSKHPKIASDPYIQKILKPTTSPREQFMNAIKLLLFSFQAGIKTFERKKARVRGESIPDTFSMGFVAPLREKPE